MKVFSKLFGFFLLVVIVCGVYAQELSWSAKRLREQVEDGNKKAILEAAEKGDVTLIPYLKQLSSNLGSRSNFNHSAFYSHAALAKLGDEDAIKEIFLDIDDESSRIQDSAIRKLSLVGGKVAFQKFYELLDDTKPRENTDCLRCTRNTTKNIPEIRDHRIAATSFIFQEAQR
jgi:HEAT repeat protein